MLSRTIEEKFSSLCELIDRITQDKSYTQISRDIWDQFSSEVKRLEVIYHDDPKNLYHVKHNYHSRLIWKMLAQENPSAAVEELKKSCIFLLKRHKAKRYLLRSIERMSVSFSIKSQHIASYLRNNSQDNQYISCTEWLRTLTKILKELRQEMGNDRLLACFLDEWWFPLIRQLQLFVLEFTNKFRMDYGNEFMSVNLLESVNESNNLIMDCFEGQFRCPYVLSLNYAIIFRLTKMSLYWHLRKVHFSGMEGSDLSKKTEMLLAQLEESAREENSNFKKYYRALKSKKLSNEQWSSIKRQKLGYEIDEKFCHYLSALYKEKDVFKALKELEVLYYHIISEVLTERIHVSEYQLRYFAEELTFLSLFVEVLLLRKDLKRARTDYFHETDDWRNQLIGEIESAFKTVISMFKYEPSDQTSVELKMITRAFTGGLPVYIIAEWIKEIVRNSLLEDQDLLSPRDTELKSLLQCIGRIQDTKKVIPHHRFPASDEFEPDVDILLGDSAIFIKNGYLSSEDMNAIRREIRYAKKNGASSTFILINFYRNMREINMMLDLKTDFEKRNYRVYVLDLKYVVERLISILRRSDKWKYQGMRDILKTMDY